MASLQCYRSAQETCETKCHDNSFGHKESQTAGMVLKGNHHGYGHHANSQGHCYGSSGYHTISKTQTQTQCCSQTQTYPDRSVVKTHCTQCVSQSHGQHAMSHCQSHSHGHSTGQHSSSHGNGMACCHGKTEKKVKSKCEYKKKKSHGNNRRDETGAAVTATVAVTATEYLLNPDEKAKFGVLGDGPATSDIMKAHCNKHVLLLS